MVHIKKRIFKKFKKIYKPLVYCLVSLTVIVAKRSKLQIPLYPFKSGEYRFPIRILLLFQVKNDWLGVSAFKTYMCGSIFFI